GCFQPSNPVLSLLGAISEPENSNENRQRIAKPLRQGFYPDRVAGGDCHHCDPGEFITPGFGQGESQGCANPVPEQLEAIEPGDGDVLRGQPRPYSQR